MVALLGLDGGAAAPAEGVYGNGNALPGAQGAAANGGSVASDGNVQRGSLEPYAGTDRNRLNVAALLGYGSGEERHKDRSGKNNRVDMAALLGYHSGTPSTTQKTEGTVAAPQRDFTASVPEGTPMVQTDAGDIIPAEGTYDWEADWQAQQLQQIEAENAAHQQFRDEFLKGWHSDDKNPKQRKLTEAEQMDFAQNLMQSPTSSVKQLGMELQQRQSRREQQENDLVRQWAEQNPEEAENAVRDYQAEQILGDRISKWINDDSPENLRAVTEAMASPAGQRAWANRRSTAADIEQARNENNAAFAREQQERLSGNAIGQLPGGESHYRRANTLLDYAQYANESVGALEQAIADAQNGSSGKTAAGRFLHGLMPRSADNVDMFRESGVLGYVADIAEKLSQGRTISDPEKALMGAYIVYSNAQADLESLGGATGWEKTGAFVSDNAPFMLEMATTGFFGAPAAAAARGLIRRGVARGIKNAAQKGIRGAVGKTLRNRVGRYVAKQGANLVGAMAEGAVTSPLSTVTARDYADRTVGEYDVRMNRDGSIEAEHARPTSELERRYKSLVTGTTERGSEAWGTFAGMGRLFPRALRGTRVYRFTAPLRRLAEAPAMRRLYRYLGDVHRWDGLPMEAMEEELNNVLQPLMTGEPERIRENFSSEAQLEMLLGLLSMSTVFQSVGMGMTAYDHVQSRRRSTELLGHIQNPDIRQQVSQAMGHFTQQQQAKAISNIDWDNASLHDMAATTDYIMHRTQGRVAQEMQRAMQEQQEAKKATLQFELFKNRNTGQLEEVFDTQGNRFYLLGGSIERSGEETADGTVFVVDPKTGVLSQKSIDELKRGKTSSYEAYEQEELERIRKVSQAQAEAEAVEEIMQEADATHSDPMPMIADYKGIDLSTLSGKTVTLRDGSTAFVNSVTANGNDFTEIDIVPLDPTTGMTRTGENGEEIHRLLNVADVTAVDGVPVGPETVAVQTTSSEGEGVASQTPELQNGQQGTLDDGEQTNIDPAQGGAIDGMSVGTQNAGTPPVQTQTAQLTTQQTAANTVERDENNLPFVKASDGTTVFGGIRKESGLPSAPIKLSEGFQDENGKGYGLAHIEANHGQQIRNAGFSSVVDFVSFVATNYDEDNIRVGKRRYDGSTTYLLQVTDTHDNTLFIELSKDGSYWNVNSAGIFRKGYSNKKETVVKTEPRQPNNAVSTGSSLSEAGHEGITSSEPNGKPTVSNIKDTNSVPSEQEIPREKDGTPVGTQNAGMENAAIGPMGQVGAENPGMNPELGNTTTSGVHTVSDPRIGRSLTPEEADDLIREMQNGAQPAPELELTPENWMAEFGENGIINTPIGDVKQGENQYLKLAQQGRNGKLGMVKPTLESPAIILEDARPAKDGKSERDTSYVFVKPFAKQDGSRYYYFTSVTVSKNGREVVISSQERSENRISKLLQQSNVAWIDSAFSLYPTAQVEGSVPLNDSNRPTATDNQPALLGVNSSELSVNKDINSVPSEQEIPRKKDGKPDYGSMEPHAMFRAIAEDFGEDVAREQVAQQISIYEGKIKKLSNSRSENINTRLENLTKIKELQEKVNALREATGIFEEETTETAPKTKTEYGRRATLREQSRGLGDYLSVEDKILRDIAEGLKFRWSDNGAQRGLGTELGFSDSPAERKARFNILSNDGTTVDRYAESLEHDMDRGVIPMAMDADMRSAILDVLSRVRSNREAFDAAMALREDDPRSSMTEEEARLQAEYNASRASVVPEVQQEETKPVENTTEQVESPAEQEAGMDAQVPDFPFRRSEAEGEAIGLDFSPEHRQAVEEMVEELNQELGENVVVFAELEELPEKVRDDVRKAMEDGYMVQGLTFNHVCYLYAPAITDKQTADYVYTHELAGHKNVEAAFSDRTSFAAFCDRLVDDIGVSEMAENIDDTGFMDCVNAYFANPDARNKYALGREYIAYLTENSNAGDLYEADYEGDFSLPSYREFITTDTLNDLIHYANSRQGRGVSQGQGRMGEQTETETGYRRADGTAGLGTSNADRLSGGGQTADSGRSRPDGVPGSGTDHALPNAAGNIPGRASADEGGNGSVGSRGTGAEEHQGSVSGQDDTGVDRDQPGTLPAGETVTQDDGPATRNDDIRFRRTQQPQEETASLIAVHNTTEDQLKKSLELGGFPMPSIAITHAEMGHTEFGEISLLFDRTSIDPVNRQNKVYGGDAWTPTFPSVGYKLNEDKTSAIYHRANKVKNLPLFNPVTFHPDNYERHVNGLDTGGLVEHFKDNYDAKQFYLAENGNAITEYEQHEVEKYPADKIPIYEDVLKRIGVERIVNGDIDSVRDEVREILEQHGVGLSQMKPNVVGVRVNNTIKAALDYAENGNKKTEIDVEATKQKIDERIDQQRFEAWLHELFNGVVEKKGIRNDRDAFTPSGNSRKWEALYDEVTLDNIVKAMQRQAARGGQGLFGGSIFGASQKEYPSIDEIREEAKRVIKNISNDEIEAQKNAITDRLSDVKIPGVGSSFSDTMDMAENIKDAVARSHTAKGIYRYLKEFYSGMTMEVAEEIADIVRDIQQMSSRYFEAKPQRAVGFDEVRLAVVPVDTDAELIRQLERRGIAVRTYERGNEEQRREIVANATEELNIRFRRAESATLSPEEINERFNEELKQQIDGTLPEGHVYRLGMPSEALRSAGVPELPIELSASRLAEKASPEYSSNHPFALDEVENLPQALQNPIAVFDSKTRLDSKVILTELQSKGHNFVAILRVQKKGPGWTEIEINDIRSLYPKDRVGGIIDWINNGLLRWVDKGKAADFLLVQGPNYLGNGENTGGDAAERLTQQRSNSADVDKLVHGLEVATNILENFENPTRLDGEKVAAAEEMAAELGVPVRIVRDRSEIGDTESMARDKRGSEGWHDRRSGEIAVVLPNCRDAAEVQKTILHEAVGHYGIPELLGRERADEFYRRVFRSLDDATQARLLAEHGSETVAGDEYLAEMAEGDVTPSVWKRIMAAIRGFFRDVLGIDLKVTDAEMRYILWRSKNNLARARTVSEAMDTIAQDIRMRAQTEREAARERKAQQLEKLRASEPIQITGEEIKPSEDLKQYKKNALEYGKTLRGEYVNQDSGERISLFAGGKNGGIKEVLQHDYKDPEHLQSVAAIPQIIENSILIDSEQNQDRRVNPDVKQYDYYVVGLKIGDTDYTVKAVVAQDDNGNRYYDHKLTQIEKGTLIDDLYRLSNSVTENQDSPMGFSASSGLSSMVGAGEAEPNIRRPETGNRLQSISPIPDTKDKRLPSILQPALTEIEKGDLIDQRDLVKAQVYDDKAANAVTGTPVATVKDKRLLQILQPEPLKYQQKSAKNAQQEPQTPMQYVDRVAEEMAARDAEEVRFRRKQTNPNDPQLTAKRNFGSAAARRLQDDTLPVRQLQDYVRKHGGQTGIETDAHSAMNRATGIATAKMQRYNETIFRRMDRAIDALRGERGKRFMPGVTRAVNAARRAMGSEAEMRETLTVEQIDAYAAAKASIERHASGVTAYSENPLDPWNRERVFQIVRDFEDEFSQEAVEELWESIRAISREQRRVALESGLISAQQYREMENRGWKYYVPLQGIDAEFEGITSPEELFGKVISANPSIRRGVSNLFRRAMGRTTKAENVLATLRANLAATVITGERNKARLFLLRLVEQNPELQGDTRAALGADRQESRENRAAELEKVNDAFNQKLQSLTEENADKTVLWLGVPSPALQSAGVGDRPMKLHGNKVIKKMKKHGFKLEELRDLPRAVADPIAVFNNKNRDGNRSILTELRTDNGNFLVTIDTGSGPDANLNVVSSVFGKADESVINWFNKGYATYVNKEKALAFLYNHSAPIAGNAANEGPETDSGLRPSAPIAGTSAAEAVASATKIVKSFENPPLPEPQNRRRGIFEIQEEWYVRRDPARMTEEEREAGLWYDRVRQAPSREEIEASNAARAEHARIVKELEQAERDCDREASKVEKRDADKLEALLERRRELSEAAQAAFERITAVRTMPRGARYAGESKMADRAHEVVVFRHGARTVIRLSDPLVAQAVTHAGQELIEGALANAVEWTRRWTRRVGALSTQWNPAFFIPNNLRDMVWAGIYNAVDSEGNFRGFVRNVHHSYAAIARAGSGHAHPLTLNERAEVNIYSPEGFTRAVERFGYKRVMDSLYDDFRMEGGLTGYSYMQEPRDIAAKMERDTNRMGTVREAAAHKLAKGFQLIGDLTEVSTRFATFLSQVQAGRDVRVAVNYARNITVNFNTRGEWGRGLNSLFMFFNASVQGVANLYKLVKRNPRAGTVMILTAGAMGYMAALMLDWALEALSDGDDGEGTWSVSEYERYTNLIIPGRLVGLDDKYFKIPVPMELRPFWIAGVLIRDVTAGRKGADEAMKEFGSALAQAFSPLEINPDQPMRAVTPTVVEPIVEINVWNTDFAGRRINRVPFPGEVVPDASLGSRNAHFIAQWVSRNLNELGGGNENTPAGYYLDDEGNLRRNWALSLLDISPSTLEHVWTSYTGGLGRELTRTVQFIAGPSEQREIRDIPVINRFFGEMRQGVGENSMYYDLRDQIETRTKLLKKNFKDGELPPYYDTPEAVQEDVEWLNYIGPQFKKSDKEIKEVINQAYTYDEGSEERFRLLNEASRMRAAFVRYYDDELRRWTRNRDD